MRPCRQQLVQAISSGRAHGGLKNTSVYCICFVFQIHELLPMDACLQAHVTKEVLNRMACFSVFKMSLHCNRIRSFAQNIEHIRMDYQLLQLFATVNCTCVLLLKN